MALTVSVKGSVQQLAKVPTSSQKSFLAWLEGKVAPSMNIAFKDGKWPYTINASKGGYSRKQLKVIQ